MPPRRFSAGSDELYAVPVDVLIREIAENNSADHGADFNYRGDFGDDDDLSDQIQENSGYSIIYPRGDSGETFPV